MTDPWQDYLTSLTGLMELDQRVAARSKQAEVLLKERLARASDESQRMLTDLARARQVVRTATTDLEQVRRSLGVEIAAEGPAHAIRTIDQARDVAVAATQWADQAKAKLQSLQRTEQRLAQVPRTQSVLTPPTRRSLHPLPLVGILIAVLLLIGSAVLGLV